MKMRRKTGVICAILVSLVTAAAAADLRIYAHDPEKSPIQILSASADADARVISFLLKNVGGQEIQLMTIAGRGFIDGKRVGGFLVTGPVMMAPGGYADVRASLDSDLFERIDTLLLIPENALSTKKEDLLHGTDPSLTIDPAKGRIVGGTDRGLSVLRHSVSPNLVNGGCCNSCYTQAQGCGKNPLKSGNCIGTCTSYYSCSYTQDAQGNCLSGTCTFNCKDVSSCC